MVLQNITHMHINSFKPQAKEAFEAFFNRDESFALGVCNGCQMLSQLSDIIPGAQHWPSFNRNVSQQFEARFSSVKIGKSHSIFNQPKLWHFQTSSSMGYAHPNLWGGGSFALLE
jgi:phosphoribosylformylglycinamidine (FGAM) synthase-like amidotransferase family enzyme